VERKTTKQCRSIFTLSERMMNRSHQIPIIVVSAVTLLISAGVAFKLFKVSLLL
jgi:hypothetical protein